MARGRPRKSDVATNGEQEPATIGHNQTPAVDEASFFDCKRELDSFDRQMNSLRGSKRNAIKNWIARGVNVKALGTVNKLAAFTATELRDELNTTIQYARYLRLPVYSQLEMFEQGDSTDEERLGESRAKGLVAGRTGAPRDCPWPVETPMGNAWLNAYDEGAKPAAA